MPEIPKGFRLFAVSLGEEGAEGPWGSLPDLLNPGTFDVFRRLGLEPYRRAVGRHFGRTVPGIFTDEAKPFGQVSYTDDLFASFRSAYGYDLRSRVHQLFGDPLTEEHVRTRLDYRRWIQKRFVDSFVVPYRRWCDANSLLLVGHFSPEDDPIQEVWCLGAATPIMRAASVPGVDVIVPYVGDERSPTLNLGSLRAGSVKSQTGGRYASSETGACTEWTITSSAVRRLYAWQKVLGIDRFFTHGFWTSEDGPANFDAPPDYGPLSSLFRGTCEANLWLERCDRAMDGGREVADVAILDSITSFWTWGPGMDESRLAALRRSLWRVVLACLQSQVGVHMVYDQELRSARVRRGALVVGARRYTHLLVPAADILDAAVASRISEAARAGVAVTWFGGGPGRAVAEPGFRLRRAAPPAGRVLREPHPSRQWCLANLPVQVAVSGSEPASCYARRFQGADGVERLLAVNVSGKPQRLRLAAPSRGAAWIPEEGMTDGDALAGTGGTQWTAPAEGASLFRLGRVASRGSAQPALRRLRETGAVRSFERLQPNVLRLDACSVEQERGRRVRRPYPQPYWQLFDDYRARRVMSQFIGDVPLESSVPCRSFRYQFRFLCRHALKGADLVVEPRSLRGLVTIRLNGRPVSDERRFPLDGIAALRLPLGGLRRGANSLEFRFAGESAMDGILCPLFVEGDFDVDAGRASVALARPAGRVSAAGWLDMGLPHYMGDGLYRWTEALDANESAAAAALEVERITDSAELRVNGAVMGTRAWAPWRWPLSGLRPGRNTFELTVSSTAGNKRSLVWPKQPQGWLGRAWLSGRDDFRPVRP